MACHCSDTLLVRREWSFLVFYVECVDAFWVPAWSEWCWVGLLWDSDALLKRNTLNEPNSRLFNFIYTCKRMFMRVESIRSVWSVLVFGLVIMRFLFGIHRFVGVFIRPTNSTNRKRFDFDNVYLLVIRTSSVRVPRIVRNSWISSCSRAGGSSGCCGGSSRWRARWRWWVVVWNSAPLLLFSRT